MFCLYDESAIGILVVLSILADFKLNLWHIPAGEIPVATMTIQNVIIAKRFEGHGLLFSESYYTYYGDKRGRRQYYSIRIAITITWVTANVIMHVIPCCG
jgi:hypothetical protein